LLKVILCRGGARPLPGGGKPWSDKNERLKRAEREEALSKLDELAEQIASAWRSPKSAVQLIEEQRR